MSEDSFREANRLRGELALARHQLAHMTKLLRRALDFVGVCTPDLTARSRWEAEVNALVESRRMND